MDLVDGSCVVCTVCPRARNASRRAVAWVDVPLPSSPSNATNVPLAMATQAISSSLPRVLRERDPAVIARIGAAPHAATNRPDAMPPNHDHAPQGSSNPEFEFSGEAAGPDADGPLFDAAGSGSFVGGDLDLSNEPMVQSSNLGGGGGKWVALIAVLLLVGGGAAWAMTGGGAAEASEAAESAETPEASAPAAVAQPETNAEPKVEPEPKAAGGPEPKAQPEPNAQAVARAESDKPEPPKAEPDKAEAGPDAKAEVEPPKTPPKKKSGGKKKKKSIKASKPPRDPLKGLPAPPS